jgi:hypothetical protein
MFNWLVIVRTVLSAKKIVKSDKLKVRILTSKYTLASKERTRIELKIGIYVCIKQDCKLFKGGNSWVMHKRVWICEMSCISPVEWPLRSSLRTGVSFSAYLYVTTGRVVTHRLPRCACHSFETRLQHSCKQCFALGVICWLGSPPAIKFNTTKHTVAEWVSSGP